MRKDIYFCDAGSVDKSCNSETKGHYILIGRAQEFVDPTRFDLCEYHSLQIFAALRDKIALPRNPTEAACP